MRIKLHFNSDGSVEVSSGNVHYTINDYEKMKKNLEYLFKNKIGAFTNYDDYFVIKLIDECTRCFNSMEFEIDPIQINKALTEVRREVALSTFISLMIYLTFQEITNEKHEFFTRFFDSLQNEVESLLPPLIQ